MQRTVDDYDSMAKREMIKAKQEKALMYVIYSIWVFIPYTCNVGVCRSSARTTLNYAKHSSD